jgi:hypothetical protein
LDQQYMDFESFKCALRTIAARKGLEEGLVHRMVAWSQEPNSEEIASGEQEQHTWPKQSQKHEILAPPPSPSHSSCGAPTLRRGHSLSSLTTGTFARDSDLNLSLPLQKRSSNVFTSMPLTSVHRNPSFQGSPPSLLRLASSAGDSNDDDALLHTSRSCLNTSRSCLNTSRSQTGDVTSRKGSKGSQSRGMVETLPGDQMPRKKYFTSMPVTYLLEPPHDSPRPRPATSPGLHHSVSAPMLQQDASTFHDQAVQHGIWPSMPLCPVIRAH